MTLIQTAHPNCIDLYMDKQVARSTDIETLASVFEKSPTEPKLNLIRCKKIANITFNVRTLLFSKLATQTYSICSRT